MIDLHCHILPEVDDGSENEQESIAIARQLSAAGFTAIIATPHVIEGSNYLTVSQILKQTEALNQILEKADIRVNVLPGAENYIFPEMASWVRSGKLMTLANTGKYLLVELPMLEIPHYTDQVFFDLQIIGITPVLAHPERNKGIVEEPELLVEWANKGVLFQLDLRSLGGRYGPEAEELAVRMLASGMVHFIGSDAHRMAQSRGAYVDELERMKELVSQEEYMRITRENPTKVVNGQELEMEREYRLKEMRRKKGWTRVFRRMFGR